VSARPLSPPRLAEALLSRLLPPGKLGSAILGDLHESYLARRESGPGSKASVWYWSQLLLLGTRFFVLRLTRKGLYRTLARTHRDTSAQRRRGTIMNDVWMDCRFAVRAFFGHPGLFLPAALVLAVGIGSVTLIFSVLNTSVLQPLPYDEPDELVWLWGASERGETNSISYDDLVDYREGTSAFESIAGFMVFSDTRVLTGREETEQVVAGRVTANFFSTLGVRPEVGRAFVPQEEETGVETVTVLSHGLWMRKFAGDPKVVGSILSLDGQPVEIVGVMPDWFDYPAGSELWVPIQRSAFYAQGRGNNNFYCVGRLRSGVSIQRAQAQTDAVAAQIAAAFPDVKAGWGIRLVTLHERLFGPAREVLLVLMGIVSLVPIVACANIASILLARASGRTTEMASRMALGASRVRLARQLLTENLLLALVGGIVGLGLVWAGGTALSSFAPGALPRIETIRIDGMVFGFTLLTALLMVPLFGVLPVLRATDVNISQELKVGGDRGMSGGRSSFRSALVVAQVALSLMLLAASGLLFRSYRNLHSQDLGFRTHDLYFAGVDLPGYRYDTYAEARADWEEIFRRLEQLPGMETLGAVSRPPLTSLGPTNDVWAAERPPADAGSRDDATRRFVTEGYFDVMGIPLVSGRRFEAGDVESEEEDPPVIINEALARHYFPGEDPLGRTLVLDYDVNRNLEIIGVVADVKEGDPGSAAAPAFYLPNRWRPRLSMTVFFRTAGRAPDLTAAFREAVSAVDPGIPAPTIRTMDGRLGERLFQPRFRTTLVALFSMVTLVLSAAGLYGVLAFFARSRRREMGIRLALGAKRTRTASLVFRRGMRLVAVGVVIGLAGAVAGARLIQGWLFGVGAMDPLTLGGVTFFLLAVGFSSCLIPSLRAMTVNPVEVLKEE
jgi:putative ABC transport system permease protein